MTEEDRPMTATEVAYRNAAYSRSVETVLIRFIADRVILPLLMDLATEIEMEDLLP